VPLSLLGIDITALRAGAVASLKSENVAQIAEQAVTLALHAEDGMHTVNFFTFNKRLEVCGLWYRQLLAESIGKTVTKKGDRFSHHLLPVVSSGADLHSMSELYLGGYKNMYTRFVTHADSSSYTVPSHHWMIEHVPFLAGKNIIDANDAIINGVLQAYDDQKLPYSRITLTESSAFEIGFLLSSFMYEMMCLAHLLDIDPFHQPSVELYKKHTRALLGN
jgi:glucose-6-phosphate isomerase